MSKRYTDRQTEKITRTNERKRVLRPKSSILKVPFPFPFSVSVSVSVALLIIYSKSILTVSQHLPRTGTSGYQS